MDIDGNWEAIAKGEVKLVAKCGNITKTYAITINEKVENPDNTGNASQEETNQPKTGDSNNMWIWIVVIALAVAVIVALLVVRHVRSKKK